MNILEAMKTGKTIRRDRGDGYSTVIEADLLKEKLDPDNFGAFLMRADDLLATNWEVREKKVTITYEDLKKAFFGSRHDILYRCDDVAKELGLL